jgi:(1->4)-alpha-D-glucan 1-alpha-D-glucosylmutase
LSSPIAAKSVEDTAFYRYGRLLSRNDVGFDVERFGDTVADFHARMQRRQATQPHSMLATATHDHKRGEDLRARLAVLSEKPAEWAQRQARWIEQSALLRTGGTPDAGDIAMLLQMIVGAWPLDLTLEDTIGRATFAQRLAGWQQKALREAKLKSDWADPDTSYEKAAQDLLRRLIVDEAAPALRAEIFAFIQDIAPAGAVNGLAQTLLRLTAPGVPDLYQGTELWDFSLVDPDNRRPVDYALRQKMLGAEVTLASWRDGAVKQRLIVRALALRAAVPDLFADGSYEPVAVEGRFAEHIVAFVRRHKSDAVLTVVPRLSRAMISAPAELALDCQNTRLSLPEELTLFNAVDERTTPITARNVALHQVLARWPVALFSTRKP